MIFKPFFASSSKVWEDISWVYGIEETGYAGWEISADGKYRLDNAVHRSEITDILTSTGLGVTVHAPYSDLNLAAINHQIWETSVRQICTCISCASELTDTITFHPGYLGPTGKLVPDKVWDLQKKALQEINITAEEYGVYACLENMPAITDLLCQNPYELEGLTEGLDNIGITVDIGHAHTTGWEKAFYPFISQAHHLHIHDNHGIADEHLPVGSGTVPWETISDRIRTSYSNQIIVIEGRSIPDAEISLKAFHRWFT